FVGPLLLGSHVVWHLRDFWVVVDRVVSYINFVPPTVGKEALNCTQLFCVCRLVHVAPGETVRIHTRRTHVAISCVHEVSLAIRPNVLVRPFCSISHVLLCRDEFPSSDYFCADTANAV